MNTEHKSPRTFGLWLLGAMFAFSALIGTLRVEQTVRLADFLREIAPDINLPWLLISGALAGLCGLGGMMISQLRLPWAPQAIFLLAGALSLLFWLDQLLFIADYSLLQRLWGFYVISNTLVLGVVVWILTRQRVRCFYHGEPQS
jgi:hypothetical protein